MKTAEEYFKEIIEKCKETIGICHKINTNVQKMLAFAKSNGK